MTRMRNGRSTFANTLKSISITTRANFGNMFSLAGASLFPPFLPLSPKQILQNNSFCGLPALTIATDSVEPESVRRPHRRDHRLNQRSVIAFGAGSSVFDFLTFTLLMLVPRAGEARFQTVWYAYLLASEAVRHRLLLQRERTSRTSPNTSPRN